MRYNQLGIAVLLVVGHAIATYGQQDVGKLIEKPDPAIEAQIWRILDVVQKPGIDPRDPDLCRELHALKKLSPDRDRLVKQLAIFVATKSPEETQKSPEETHVLILNEMLRLLDIPPRIIIRVLAPYLDADNRRLRDSVRLWFRFHAGGGSAPERAPPITPVNYEEYLRYVGWKVTNKEEVPAPFIKYIFERSPGRALLVFAYANSHGDVTARLQAIRLSIEGAQPETKEQQEQYEKGRKQQTKESREARLRERRDIELSEHIVSNAIWLKEHEFAERFQVALPEAMAELEKLAKHEWWARLYVAYIMRQHPELRQPAVVQQLADDPDPLVSKTAKSIRQ